MREVTVEGNLRVLRSPRNESLHDDDDDDVVPFNECLLAMMHVVYAAGDDGIGEEEMLRQCGIIHDWLAKLHIDAGALHLWQQGKLALSVTDDEVRMRLAKGA